MLMASVHVHMMPVRYRDNINIASCFPAPTPITHAPLACACSSTQAVFYQVLLHFLKKSHEFAGV